MAVEQVGLEAGVASRVEAWQRQDPPAQVCAACGLQLVPRQSHDEYAQTTRGRRGHEGGPMKENASVREMKAEVKRLEGAIAQWEQDGLKYQTLMAEAKTAVTTCQGLKRYWQRQIRLSATGKQVA